MNANLYGGSGVVLRIGELFLKRGNRHLFMDVLVNNVRRALGKRPDVSIFKGSGRIFIAGACDPDLLERLEWVFGIASYSPVVFCQKDIEVISQTAIALAKEEAMPEGSVFRIAARRSDKKFSHRSTEIGRIVGSAVNVATGMGVDLEKPDLSIGVEVGPEWVCLWTRQLPGCGGLPVGTSGKVTLLLSGGLDSPVAGHMLQKRGLEIGAAYFHAFPYTGDGARDKVVQLARVLATRQKKLKLWVVQFARIQEALRDVCAPGYLVLLYRRSMVRIADALRLKDGAVALATGESLGQVASQTLANMGVVEEASTVPILRPLITFDKYETVALAKRIGTYEISIQPHDDCCTLFVPRHPETKGTVKRALQFEKKVDLSALEEEAVASAELIEL